MYVRPKILFLFLILLFFESCSYKKNSSNYVQKNIQSPIFIKMPKNVLVFDNIASIVYKSIWDCYDKLGYNLVSKKNAEFIFDITIKSVTSPEKLVSADILLYGQKIKLELLCKIFDSSNKLIAEKLFVDAALLSRPNDPLMLSSFFDSAYRQLMDKISFKIEKYFRKYLVNKSN